MPKKSLTQQQIQREVQRDAYAQPAHGAEQQRTVTVVLAIGFGAFLLGTLVLVQLNLLDQLRLAGGPARPNLVLFDIQPDQLATVERELREAGLSAAAPVPIVPMRIASV